MFKRLINAMKARLNPPPVWYDGYAPEHIPRSYITEGMRRDPNDPRGVIPTWKFNSAYYESLL